MTKYGSFNTALRTNGGNRSGTGKTQYLDSKECDLVFIVCEDGTQYLFPIEILEGKSSVNLPGKYQEYMVL